MPRTGMPFDLKKVHADILISVMNKMRPECYAKMHRSSKHLLEFLLNNHWRISIRVPETLGFWFSYPRGSGRGGFVVNLMLHRKNGSPLLYNIGTAFKNFAGFCFAAIDTNFLEIYEPRMTEYQRAQVFKFLENRIWRNTAVIITKKVSPQVLNAIRPRILKLNEFPTEIPDSVRELYLPQIHYEDFNRSGGLLLQVNKLYTSTGRENLQNVLETLIRLWKRNQHGNLLLYQTRFCLNIDGHEQLADAARALPRCDAFHAVTEMIEDQMFLPIQVETTVNLIKKTAVVKLIVMSDNVEKPACLALLLRKMPESQKLSCIEHAAFCTDMDKIDVLAEFML